MRRTAGSRPARAAIAHAVRVAALTMLFAGALFVTQGAPQRAEALFHFAVIDEVMFGYGGDPDIQYVEVRMLSGGQNITAHAILGYFNTNGTYGGDILEVPSNATNGSANGRYVMASTDFAAAAGITPDFTFVPVTLPATGMICFGGGGGVIPANPPAWTRTTMSNWIDCVTYGGYAGPPIAFGPATPFGLGDGTNSLTRLTDTDNSSVDFALACPGPQVGTNAVGFNHDNHIDLPPTKAFDDLTYPRSDLVGDGCGDLDDDNDGLDDVDELSLPGPACVTATAALNPLRGDSDGDRYLDLAECALGFDPASAASTPVLTSCGPAGDPDGDKIQTRLEQCFYDTNPASNDTDGDMAAAGARDGCEIASINSDRIVNSGDQGALAANIGAAAGGPNYIVDYDLNKDGNINSGDQGQMASLISPPGQCP